MKNKPILIVAGEPNSVFFEIFFKSIKYKKYKSPIILIASLDLLYIQLKKLKFKKKIRILNIDNLKDIRLNNNLINIIDVKFDIKKSKKINNYIHQSFAVAFKIINLGHTNRMINGPINKESFLNKKFLGITEYISSKFGVKKNAMLIYNKRLSVCPVTTHLPIKLISKKITKKLIMEKIVLINNFYKKNIGIKPKIAITGLNPHCESVLKDNEDKQIIRPSIQKACNLGYKVSGPYPADTIFQKKNRLKFNVIIGMYHDQVLAPIKTLFEFDAINITLGLPFYRISPDHGPNENMLGMNLSSPLSLIRAIEFLDNK
ncbi:4-hydroxythreonine-4-phosphate dehydrogenase PdxA [Candidatus Pelagibacter sp.]|nr:4-hydroxythreonine-4-phosphate dehydrogenase PdxA [Candidatus Pelagibacter sp.]